MENEDRPAFVILTYDTPHWMPNIQRKGCQEAKGINVEMKAGSIGKYNAEYDRYEFDPMKGTESHGIRAGQDPGKPEYYKFWYISYNVIPTFMGEFVAASLKMKPSSLFAELPKR